MARMCFVYCDRDLHKNTVTPDLSDKQGWCRRRRRLTSLLLAVDTNRENENLGIIARMGTQNPPVFDSGCGVSIGHG